MNRSPNHTEKKHSLHPRNLHRKGYDFDRLVEVLPELAKHLFVNEYGTTTVNFADSEAVLCLNRAILRSDYGVQNWSIPENFLCPPIPGRVDYLHYLADLLKVGNLNKIPVGKKVKGLDIGTGANCIYPLLGSSVYGWQFVASDIEQMSIDSARGNIDKNPLLKPLVECRKQNHPNHIFTGVIHAGEYYDFSMCNPPFHASQSAAQKGSKRKVGNLTGQKVTGKAKLNFGGQQNELWCEGGELAFIKKMILESRDFKHQCYWFTTLVSKKDNLYPLKKALKRAGVTQTKTVKMEQGNKISRFIAWSFFDKGTPLPCANIR